MCRENVLSISSWLNTPTFLINRIAHFSPPLNTRIFKFYALYRVIEITRILLIVWCMYIMRQHGVIVLFLILYSRVTAWDIADAQFITVFVFRRDAAVSAHFTHTIKLCPSRVQKVKPIFWYGNVVIGRKFMLVSNILDQFCYCI